MKKNYLLITVFVLFCITLTSFTVRANVTHPDKTTAEKVPEKFREELKTYHEKMRAIKEECKQKYTALKNTLSPEAQVFVKKPKFKKRTRKQ